MKLLLIILTSAFVQQSLQQSLEDLKEVARASVVDCYEDDENTKKIEITEADIEDIGKCSHGADRNVKCVYYCILKKYNWFSPNNTLNESEIIPVFVHVFNDAIDENHLKNIIAECNIEISGENDRCERSYMANTCISTKISSSRIKKF